MPFTGIVHHLSGPNTCAHAQTLSRYMIGCCCKISSCHLRYIMRVLTYDVAHALDSLVRVSRRVELNLSINNMHPPESTELHIDSARKRGIVCTSFLRADALADFCEQFTSKTVADGEPKGLTPRLPPSHRQFVSICWFNSLSIQYSQTLLTLFSKSFSSFPRGTCALSDSVVY